MQGKPSIMRVLQLTDADVFAGTERLVLELSASLERQGVTATIGCPPISPLADRAASEGIAILPVGIPHQPKGGRADATTVRRLRAALRQRAFDLVHVHNGRSAFIAALAGAGRAVPMVMTQHFLSPARTTRRGWRGWFSKQVHGWLGRRIVRHVAISEAVRQAAIAAGIAAPEAIEVILNGIRPPAAGNAKKLAERERWVGQAKPLIFCAARAEREKDLPTLIEAMRLVVASQPQAQCAVAGSGRDLETLRQLTVEAGLSEKFHWLGFRDDVADWLSAADIFVLPSVAEPFGLSIVEAMACGKPVVACKAGGPPEIVADGVSGILVPPQSPKEMAAALASLAGDAAWRQRMGEAGRERFQQVFTADRMAQEMAALYRRVVTADAALRR